MTQLNIFPESDRFLPTSMLSPYPSDHIWITSKPPTGLSPLPFTLGYQVAAKIIPGGPVVKNLSYNAGHAGWIPGQGTKIPSATGQLRPHMATTEPAGHN